MNRTTSSLSSNTFKPPLVLIHGDREIAAFAGQRQYSWQQSVSDRLEYLIRLENGWDGYKAPPVSFQNAAFGHHMLKAICDPWTEAPSVVPGFKGDLQFEWHLEKGDIELWVKSPNLVEAWLYDSQTGQEFEVTLSTDFKIVSTWLRNLSGHQLAIATTA